VVDFVRVWRVQIAEQMHHDGFLRLRLLTTKG